MNSPNDIGRQFCPCGHAFQSSEPTRTGEFRRSRARSAKCPACGLSLPSTAAAYHEGIARSLAELRTEVDWLEAIAAELEDQVAAAPTARARAALLVIVHEATMAVERLAAALGMRSCASTDDAQHRAQVHRRPRVLTPIDCSPVALQRDDSAPKQVLRVGRASDGRADF